jgi:transposase-like protein
MARGWGGPQDARMRKEYTRKQRSELVELVTAGAAVSEAAALLGVRPSTAYAWLRSATATDRDPPRLAVAPRFVRVVPSREAGAALTVRVRTAEIEVWPGFDADLLRAVVEALAGGAA